MMPAPHDLVGGSNLRRRLINDEAAPHEGAAAAGLEATPRPRQPHRRHRIRDHRGRDAGIHQRGDRHVTGDTRDGIEVNMQALQSLRGHGRGHTLTARPRFNMAAM